MDFELVELGGDAFSLRNEQDGKVLAEITWTMLGDVMVVDHTYVSSELRGRGVAKQLLDGAAEYAREKGHKIEPVCSYVVTAFERFKEYEDLKVN